MVFCYSASRNAADTASARKRLLFYNHQLKTNALFACSGLSYHILKLTMAICIQLSYPHPEVPLELTAPNPPPPINAQSMGVKKCKKFYHPTSRSQAPKTWVFPCKYNRSSKSYALQFRHLKWESPCQEKTGSQPNDDRISHNRLVQIGQSTAKSVNSKISRRPTLGWEFK